MGTRITSKDIYSAGIELALWYRRYLLSMRQIEAAKTAYGIGAPVRVLRFVDWARTNGERTDLDAIRFVVDRRKKGGFDDWMMSANEGDFEGKRERVLDRALRELQDMYRYGDGDEKDLFNWAESVVSK